MHSGSPLPARSPGLATSIGIASLILEGRPNCDDGESEKPPLRATVFGGASTSSHHAKLSLASNHHVPCSLDIGHQQQQSASSTSAAAYHAQPSSSQQSNSSGMHGDTVQRLRQKLMLIRSAPGTSRDAIQHAIAVPSGSSSRYTASIDSDDDLDVVFPAQQPPQVQHREEGGFINSLLTLATNTCLNTTPRSFGRMPDLMSIVDAWTTSGYVTRCADGPIPPVDRAATELSGCKNSTNNVGPHCEEFLKKIGLIKSAKDAASSTSTPNTTPIRTKSTPVNVYVEEHVCSDTNTTVSFF